MQGVEPSEISVHALAPPEGENKLMNNVDDERSEKRVKKRMWSVEDFRAHVEERVDIVRRQYWNEGADAQLTLRDNTEAFTRFRLRPRLLRGCDEVCTETTLLGQKVGLPVGFSPTAYHRWAHPSGETASARASEAFGTVMILSSYTNTPMAEVREGVPGALLWAQLYLQSGRYRVLTLGVVRRAERLGFKALVVTLDSPVLGNKINDRRQQGYFPRHLRLPNYEECFADAVATGAKDETVFDFADAVLCACVSWDDFRWLCSSTSLPVVAKGILTEEDARLAVANGAAAILVSNHGGRQLDNVAATIEALPEVVAAVGNTNVEVYLDGGVRRGTDVLKALALGAKAVFIGRPVIWGLAYDGEDGVREVLGILKEEFKRAMSLTGAANISEIVPSMVVRASHYNNRLQPSS